VYGIGIPLSWRRWKRIDRRERERVSAILRRLAADLGGEFEGPRLIRLVDEDGVDWGAWPDSGTALVTVAGLQVEVGVQLGGPAPKCLRLRVPRPAGRAWPEVTLRARRVGPWLTGVPAPRTFRLAFRSAGAERLGAEARAALLALRADAVDLRLGPDGLTVWVLRSSSRGDARMDGIRDAAQVTPHVRRVAEVARLLAS
jgi:hypothetical protein